jgi:hypothetical protein
VRALEVVRLGLGKRVIEELLESRAIDPRIELCVRPRFGGPRELCGMGGERKEGRAGQGQSIDERVSVLPNVTERSEYPSDDCSPLLRVA